MNRSVLSFVLMALFLFGSAPFLKSMGSDSIDYAGDLAPEHVPTLKKACEGINCTNNTDYDDFLRNQLDE